MSPEDNDPQIAPDDVERALEVHAGDPDSLAQAIERALAHPHADKHYFAGDLLKGLADAYAAAGRADQAIAAHERALAAGYTAVPDPRMDQATYLG